MGEGKTGWKQLTAPFEEKIIIIKMGLFLK